MFSILPWQADDDSPQDNPYLRVASQYRYLGEIYESIKNTKEAAKYFDLFVERELEGTNNWQG